MAEVNNEIIYNGNGELKLMEFETVSVIKQDITKNMSEYNDRTQYLEPQKEIVMELNASHSFSHSVTMLESKSVKMSSTRTLTIVTETLENTTTIEKVENQTAVSVLECNQFEVSINDGAEKETESDNESSTFVTDVLGSATSTIEKVENQSDMSVLECNQFEVSIDEGAENEPESDNESSTIVTDVLGSATSTEKVENQSAVSVLECNQFEVSIDEVSKNETESDNESSTIVTDVLGYATSTRKVENQSAVSVLECNQFEVSIDEGSKNETESDNESSTFVTDVLGRATSTEKVESQSAFSVLECNQFKVSIEEGSKNETESDNETSITTEHTLKRYVSLEEVNIEDMRQTYIVSTYRHLSKNFDIETSGKSVFQDESREDTSEDLCDLVLSEVFLEISGNLSKMSEIDDIPKCEKEDTEQNHPKFVPKCEKEDTQQNTPKSLPKCEKEDTEQNTPEQNNSFGQIQYDSQTNTKFNEPDLNANKQLSTKEARNHEDIINPEMAMLESLTSIKMESFESNDVFSVCAHPKQNVDNPLNDEFSAESITTCSVVESNQHYESAQTICYEDKTGNEPVTQDEKKTTISDSETQNSSKHYLHEKVHEDENIHVEEKNVLFVAENQHKECTKTMSESVQQTQTVETKHDRDGANVIHYIDDTRKTVLKELWYSHSNDFESTQQNIPAGQSVIDKLTITQLLDEEEEMIDIQVKPLPQTVPAGKLKTSISSSQLNKKSGHKKVKFMDVPSEYVYQSNKIMESENKMSLLIKDIPKSEFEVDYFQDELERQKSEFQLMTALVEPVAIEKLTINELLNLTQVSRKLSKEEPAAVNENSSKEVKETTIHQQIEQQFLTGQTSTDEWSIKITVEEHTLVTYDSDIESNTGETGNESPLSSSFSSDNENAKEVSKNSNTNSVDIPVEECKNVNPTPNNHVEPPNPVMPDSATIVTTEVVTEKKSVISRNEERGLHEHAKNKVDGLPMFYLKESSSDNDFDSSSSQDSGKLFDTNNGHTVKRIDSGLHQNGNPIVIVDKNTPSGNKTPVEENRVVESPVNLDELYLNELRRQHQVVETGSRVEGKRTVIENLTISDLLVRNNGKGTGTTQSNEKKKEIDYFKEELNRQNIQANSNTNEHLKSPEATLEKMSISDLLESKPTTKFSEHHVIVATENKSLEPPKTGQIHSVQAFTVVNSFHNDILEKRQNSLPKIEEEEQVTECFAASNESIPYISENSPKTKAFFSADIYETESSSSSDSDDQQSGLLIENEKYSGEILLDSCEIESLCESDFDEPDETIVTQNVTLTESNKPDVSKSFLGSSGIKGMVEVKEKISLKQYATIQSVSVKQIDNLIDNRTSKENNSSVCNGFAVKDDNNIDKVPRLEAESLKKDINGNEGTLYGEHLKVTNMGVDFEEPELKSKSLESSDFSNDRIDQAEVDSSVILSTSAQDYQHQNNIEHGYVTCNVNSIEMCESDNETEIDVFTDNHKEAEREILSNNATDWKSSYRFFNEDVMEDDSLENLQNDSIDDLEKAFDEDIERYFKSRLKDIERSESFQDEESHDVDTLKTDIDLGTEIEPAVAETKTLTLVETNKQFAKADNDNLTINEHSSSTTQIMLDRHESVENDYIPDQRNKMAALNVETESESLKKTLALDEANKQFANTDNNNLTINEHLSSTAQMMLDKNELVDNDYIPDQRNKRAVVNVETKSESMEFYTEKQLSVFTKETWEKFKIHRSENDVSQQEQTWSESGNTSASMSLDTLRLDNKERNGGQRTVSSDWETNTQFLQMKHYGAKPRLETRISKESVSSSILDSTLDILQKLVGDSHSHNLSADMSMGIGGCCRCGEGFGQHQQIVNSNGEVWHPQCFVCAQCFQPFPDGVFYEFEGRKYCEHDFHVLFAPCCGKCGEFIVGRVIKALNNSWHPDCFRCQLCDNSLADTGFVKNAGRALCRDCNAHEKARAIGKYVCHKCHAIIEEGHIKYKGEAFHPYHFNCNSCSVELNADAREVNGELYCLRCHDKMGIPICGACRRPIEERVVHALGKAWHVEHFVCAKCEKPFFGTRHYEKKGLAYCEIHYHQLFGNICFTCNSVISGDVFHAFNKAWHVNHFGCSICDRKMSQKTKFFEFDLKPVCKFCYEKFPGELKKRLKKAYDEQAKK